MSARGSEESNNHSGSPSRNSTIWSRANSAIGQHESILPDAHIQENVHSALLPPATRERLRMMEEEAWLMRLRLQQQWSVFPAESTTRRTADLDALLQQREYSARAVAASGALGSYDPIYASSLMPGSLGPSSYLSTRYAPVGGCSRDTLSRLRYEEDLITALGGRGDGQVPRPSSSLLWRMLPEEGIEGGSEGLATTRPSLLYPRSSTQPHSKAATYLQEQQELRKSQALQDLVLEQYREQQELLAAQQRRLQERAMGLERHRQQELMAQHQSPDVEALYLQEYREFLAARRLQGRNAVGGEPSVSLFLESLALQRREEQEHQRATLASLPPLGRLASPALSTDPLQGRQSRHNSAEEKEGTLRASSQHQPHRRPEETASSSPMPPNHSVPSVATAAEQIPRQEQTSRPVPIQMASAEQKLESAWTTPKDTLVASLSAKKTPRGRDVFSLSCSTSKRKRGSPKDDGSGKDHGSLKVTETVSDSQIDRNGGEDCTKLLPPLDTLDTTCKTSQMWVKTKRKRPDDGRPKRPLSAYNFFFQEERGRMVAIAKAANGNKRNTGLSFEELAKTIAPKWKLVDPEARQRFQEMASADFERYQVEMRAYNENKSKTMPDQEQVSKVEGHKN